MTGGILLFGSAGQVGHELADLAGIRNVVLTGLSHADVDIADKAAVEAAVASLSPSFIVNAAAYVAVDEAERNAEIAHAANALGPRNIAESARGHGVPVIHLSTDYVFDGSKQTAYVETDPIAPLGVYGTTKAAGEQAVRESGASHVILRSSWIFGRHGRNFVKTMLRLAMTQDVLRVVVDQRGCPTASIDLAQAILAICDRLEQDAGLTGTFHFAGTDVTSRHGLATAVIDAQAPYTGRHPRVEAVETKDYSTPARRPANSELDSSRFMQTFGYRAMPWQERVRETVGDLCGRVLAA